MPTYRTRYEWTKVYRPNGTKYAGAKNARPDDAVRIALLNFISEFGREVRQEQAVIEVVGVTGEWCATVWEIDDMKAPS